MDQLKERREQLHSILCGILGSTNVYFQPASNISMKYPAIVYKRSDIDATFANNLPYSLETRYEVTLIDQSPTSSTVGKLASLPKTRHNRWFAADNLNHDVFTLYY